MKTLKQFAKAEFWITALLITCNIIMGGNTAYAQSNMPDRVDVNINTNSNPGWYSQPWVWIVGVALFIIVVIAITRSGSREF